MNRKTMLALGTILAFTSTAAPNATAHFANGFVTHEHPFFLPGGFGAGNFAQRLCVDPGAPLIVPSAVNGDCPPGYTPIPPARGLRSGETLGALGCVDFTIPHDSLMNRILRGEDGGSDAYAALGVGWVGGTYTRVAAPAYSGEKDTPHAGVYGPSTAGPPAGTALHPTLITDSADGSDWFESDDVNHRLAGGGVDSFGTTHEWGQPDTIYAAGASVGPTNGASNRYVVYPAPLAPGAGAQMLLDDAQ